VARGNGEQAWKLGLERDETRFDALDVIAGQRLFVNAQRSARVMIPGQLARKRELRLDDWANPEHHYEQAMPPNRGRRPLRTLSDARIRSEIEALIIFLEPLRIFPER
jgi:hypothetical protein